MTDDSAARAYELESRLDVTHPHSARVWNHWLGGKDNYPADREVGERIREIYPAIVDIARHSRAFLGRAVRHLAGEVGIRQFLDVGTGLPTVDNTHEIAQRVAPASHVVYVDNDPLVLAHARALLTGDPRGVTDYVDADVRRPVDVLRAAERTLDFDRPVALMLLGIMGQIVDDEEAYAITRRLLDALPSGSYLVLQDGTNIVHSDDAARIERFRAERGAPYRLRDPERVARFFDGLELLDPGVVSVTRWRPDPEPFETPEVDSLGAVGHKP